MAHRPLTELARPAPAAVPRTPRDAEISADLVQRLRSGEPRAVAELYDAHHAALRAFARRLVGEAALAEDLVHDVFVALPGAIKRFRGESTLRTFLMAIAVNRARRHVRSAARRRAAMARLAEEPETLSDRPDRDVARRELAAALSRGLDALPLDQRVAFVLCEVDQLTSREAAVIAGAPEETLRTRLFHARRKLRAFLEGEGVR
jgi:RNA polymerase sigma-70 factor, ECF subfamily